MISMAPSSFSMEFTDYCVCDLTLNKRTFRVIELTILPDACTEVILGVPLIKVILTSNENQKR